MKFRENHEFHDSWSPRPRDRKAVTLFSKRVEGMRGSEIYKSWIFMIFSWIHEFHTGNDFVIVR